MALNGGDVAGKIFRVVEVFPGPDHPDRPVSRKLHFDASWARRSVAKAVSEANSAIHKKRKRVQSLLEHI